MPEPFGVVLIFVSWNFPICESNLLPATTVLIFFFLEVVDSSKNGFILMAPYIQYRVLCEKIISIF